MIGHTKISLEEKGETRTIKQVPQTKKTPGFNTALPQTPYQSPMALADDAHMSGSAASGTGDISDMMPTVSPEPEKRDEKVAPKDPQPPQVQGTVPSINKMSSVVHNLGFVGGTL